MDKTEVKNKMMGSQKVKHKSMNKSNDGLIHKGGRLFKRYQLNVDLRDNKRGDILELEVDKAGKLKDQYWRKRLDDVKLDNCIVEVK